MKRLIGDGGARDHSKLRDVRVSLLEAGCPAPVGEDQRLGRSDYYFHGDPKTFINDVPHFYRLRYRNAWPGVDLMVRGWEDVLEISLSFAAGAELGAVGMRWIEGEPLALGDGTVIVTAPWGVVRQVRPQGLAWRAESSGVLRLA